MGAGHHVLSPIVKETGVTGTGHNMGAITQPRAEGPRILLVEDEEPILYLLTNVLTRFGYQVVGVDGPGNALSTAEELDEDIHLLVTDVAMPGMTGVELHRQLSHRRPGLPVLYLTGYAGTAAEEFGVPEESLLAKPFSLKALSERVTEILSDLRTSLSSEG